MDSTVDKNGIGLLGVEQSDAAGQGERQPSGSGGEQGAPGTQESDRDRIDYQVIIIGGGPSGYAAALYTTRAELSTLALEGPLPGGQAAMTDIIENYPGMKPVSGYQLVEDMKAQATVFGARSEMATVCGVSPGGDHVKLVQLEDGRNLRARAVIVASGARPRRLGAPGEERLTGRGVSYCATCDGPFFRDKDVAVIGGGDSAIKEAIYLSKIARSVQIVHRREFLRAEKAVQRAAFSNSKIKFNYYYVVDEILGDEFVTSMSVRNCRTGEREEMAMDGVFIYIGMDPATSYLAGLGITDEDGWVVTDGEMRTTVPGVFAAGDVRRKQFKQVATAVGDGALAAWSVQEYVTGLEISRASDKMCGEQVPDNCVLPLPMGG